jgi:hypothetical protein
VKALISSRIEKNTISTIESFNETFDEKVLPFGLALPERH